MFVPFLIMFREGLEAALIAGLIAGYLARTGRQAWLPLVWLGIGAGVLASLAAGLAIELLSTEFPQRGQEIFEAAVALVAVAILTGMVFWMRRAGASVKAELHGRIEASLAGEGRGIALVGMVFLAVVREGLEATVFLLAVTKQSQGWAAPIGAAAGLLAAVLSGLGIFWGGLRLNLKHFFRWSGVLILFVAAGLLAGALRALHEAGLWNGLQRVVFDFGSVLPADSLLGSALGGLFGYLERPVLGEALAYLLYLLVALPLFLRPVSPVAAAAAEQPTATTLPPRLLRPAMVAFSLLAIAVVGLGAAVAWQEPARRADADASVVTVTVTPTGCSPSEVSVTAGRTAFRIVNHSDRALEWEILDGVMVLEERENIAPGLGQGLTARLDPGTYAMTCGRIGTRRGRLIVLPASETGPWRPTARDLLGPMAEYRVYVTLQAMALREAAEDLADALAARDLPRVRNLVAEAQAAAGRLRPALLQLPDAAGAIQPVDDALSRIAAQAGTNTAMDAAAATLAAGAETLAARVTTLRATPAAMAEAAAQTLRGPMPPEDAALEGVARIVTLLRPLAAHADPALAGRLDNQLAATRRGDAAARDALAADLDNLAPRLRVG